MTPPLTVWYNTRCPVCKAGIDWQRNRLLRAVRAGDIAFKDINFEPDALAAFGATLNDIRRRLHATDSTGALFIGADCAREIWRRTPGDAWLYWLARGSGPVGRWIYNGFADVLYGWNKRRGHW